MEYDFEQRSAERNSLLDFLKGCGCLGVVFIHVMFPGKFGIAVHMLSQYAVPVFYMTAGYYACCTAEGSSDRVFRRLRHIVRIALCACLFYTLLTLLIIKIEHGDIGDWKAQFASWELWLKIIIDGDFEVISASHLWFLPAMIYTYILLYFIERKKLCEWAYRLIPVLFILKIVITTIILSFNYLSWHVYGNIICAMPWMLLGNYIAYNKKFSPGFTNRRLIAVSICGGVLP